MELSTIKQTDKHVFNPVSSVFVEMLMTVIILLLGVSIGTTQKIYPQPVLFWYFIMKDGQHWYELYTV